MLLVLVVTGLILPGWITAAASSGPSYWLLSCRCRISSAGWQTIRFIHHMFTWLVILFVVVHVYMAFWYDVVFKEGTISSMVSGRVFRKPHD